MTQDNFITKSPHQHGKLEKLESGVHGTIYSQFDRFIRFTGSLTGLSLF